MVNFQSGNGLYTIANELIINTHNFIVYTVNKYSTQ